MGWILKNKLRIFTNIVIKSSINGSIIV